MTRTNGGIDIADTLLAPGQTVKFTFPPTYEFRKSTNEIEGKEWYEMDVSKADTIVILHDGKRVEMDKKDFLQKVGLEW